MNISPSSSSSESGSPTDDSDNFADDVKVLSLCLLLSLKSRNWLFSASRLLVSSCSNSKFFIRSITLPRSPSWISDPGLITLKPFYETVKLQIIIMSLYFQNQSWFLLIAICGLQNIFIILIYSINSTCFLLTCEMKNTYCIYTVGESKLPIMGITRAFGQKCCPLPSLVRFF